MPWPHGHSIPGLRRASIGKHGTPRNVGQLYLHGKCEGRTRQTKGEEPGVLHLLDATARWNRLQPHASGAALHATCRGMQTAPASSISRSYYKHTSIHSVPACSPQAQDTLCRASGAPIRSCAATGPQTAAHARPVCTETCNRVVITEQTHANAACLLAQVCFRGAQCTQELEQPI